MNVWKCEEVALGSGQDSLARERSIVCAAGCTYGFERLKRYLGQPVDSTDTTLVIKLF